MRFVRRDMIEIAGAILMVFMFISLVFQKSQIEDLANKQAQSASVVEAIDHVNLVPLPIYIRNMDQGVNISLDIFRKDIEELKIGVDAQNKSLRAFEIAYSNLSLATSQKLGMVQYFLSQGDRPAARVMLLSALAEIPDLPMLMGCGRNPSSKLLRRWVPESFISLLRYSPFSVERIEGKYGPEFLIGVKEGAVLRGPC